MIKTANVESKYTFSWWWSIVKDLLLAKRLQTNQRKYTVSPPSVILFRIKTLLNMAALISVYISVQISDMSIGGWRRCGGVVWTHSKFKVLSAFSTVWTCSLYKWFSRWTLCEVSRDQVVIDIRLPLLHNCIRFSQQIYLLYYYLLYSSQHPPCIYIFADFFYRFCGVQFEK